MTPYIFSKMVDSIPCYLFDKLVAKYRGLSLEVHKEITCAKYHLHRI